MARTAKNETVLTPEEKLAQALVPEEEQPYKVPENWCWTYLTRGYAECKDICRKPINATERAGRIGDIPYYGATGQVGWIDDYLTDEELVLLGEDGAPFLDLLKDKAYLISGKAWVNNHAHILKSFFGHIGNLYLLNYLNVFNFTGYVNGTTRLKLTQSSMDTIPVPVPPLAEQQRIVDRIESLFANLDEAKEKAQAVVDGFEDRKAAILHKAFTGELTAEWRAKREIAQSSWEKKKIADFAEVKGGKRLPKGCSLTTEKTDHPYLRIADFGVDTIDQSDIHYITDNIYQQISRYIIETGDVYISIVGTIGRCGTVPEELSGANLTENAARIITRTTLPRYLVGFLSSPKAQEDIKGRIRSATLGKLSLTNINNIVVPIPTKEEQQEIITILDKLLKMEIQAKETSEQVIDQIDTMKKSILARAFRGEFGTNDPTDESAEELLKRVL